MQVLLHGCESATFYVEDQREGLSGQIVVVVAENELATIDEWLYYD